MRLAVLHQVVIEIGYLHPADDRHDALHDLAVGGLQQQHAVALAIGSGRQLPRGEDFGAALVRRAGGIGHRPRELADLDDADAFRHGEVAHRRAGQRPFHDVVPDGRRTGDAGDVLHLRVVVVAHPDAHRQIRRVAHRPVVAEIVGGARLGRRRTRQAQRAVGSEGRGARPVVGQDGGDEVGLLRRHDLLAGWRHVLFQNLPVGAGHVQHGHGGHAQAAVGEGGVGSGQLQQGDLAAAQGEGQAVVGAGERGDAQAAGHVAQGWQPHMLQGLHRRDVVGVGQRRAHGDPAVGFAVVVDGHVGRVGSVGELGAHVLDERGRRPPVLLLLEGGQVGQRLDGRAGLPLPQRHVHLAVNVGVVEVHAAQHGQDLAGLRLQH